MLKQEARTNLDAANTNSDVTTAKDNGIAAINQVQAATTKKSDAKAEIAQKASERKTAIEAMNDSTTEEQQAAKDKVDQAVVTANADIDNAAANADVDNAKLQMKLQSQPLHLMQMLNQQRNKQLLTKYRHKRQQLMEITAQQQKKKKLLNNKFKLKNGC